MTTHALLSPTATCCGKTGRAVWSGDKPAVVATEADAVFRIGEPVTCRGCLRYLAKHGPPLNWQAVHLAGEPSNAKRRRRRLVRGPSPAC
jgi:hypothetical protein